MFISYILDTLLIKLTRGTDMNMICANKSGIYQAQRFIAFEQLYIIV